MPIRVPLLLALPAMLLALGSAASPAVQARGEPARAGALAALFDAPEVGAEALEALRGGFEAPEGLRVSFGIERVVVVNGVVQSSTQVFVEELGRAIATGTGPADLLPPATVAVIQNGVNNSVSIGLPGPALATIVQNSLDNQHLQTLTTINAVVNSAEMLRGLRMQQSLQDAVNRAALN